MGNMGAACIASAGFGLTSGSGISISTFPIVPDYKKYADTKGRKLGQTFASIGCRALVKIGFTPCLYLQGKNETTMVVNT